MNKSDLFHQLLGVHGHVDAAFGFIRTKRRMLNADFAGSVAANVKSRIDTICSDSNKSLKGVYLKDNPSSVY